MPQKGTSTLRMRVCRQCGIEFMGGPRAWYCPTCRIERQREQGRTCKQRQRKGQTRRLGSIDKCEVCGKDYIVNSARQRYCPDCAPERYREVDREQSRGWMKRAIEVHGEEYLEEHLKRKRENYRKNTENQRICPMCGGIVPFGEKKFCSEQCRNAAERYAYAKHNYKIGRLKAEPNFADYAKGGRLYEKRADVIGKYAALRRIMLESYQSAPAAYDKAAKEMSELLATCQKRTDADLITQAIYYQDIIIDCERQMPLPSGSDGRTAGNYKVHRYTMQEYNDARDNLQILCGNNVRVGDVFGEWTVLRTLPDNIYVLCRCSCGKERPVSKYTLLTGKSVSCGHTRALNNLKRRRAEFIGKTFNEWTVLDVFPGRDALCRCSCGTVKKMFLSTVISGRSKSCGCKRNAGHEQESEQAMAAGRAYKEAFTAEGLTVMYLGKKVNKNSSTGITGVGIYRNARTGEEMYRAYITVKRRQIALGLFRNIDDAIAARKAAEEKYFEPLQERVDAIKDTLKNSGGKKF